ncbi:hypothetical protein ACFPIJ_10645 [Dactylosporangium cerinum]|uniref:Uncharacterized protein n=1 Tax=Dactylosporangium cerinum TaxID=1434730 RepID=A0ABV9VUI2_9ACTN
MEPDKHDDEESTSVPGAGTLVLIGVVGILIIVGFLYTVMTG